MKSVQNIELGMTPPQAVEIEEAVLGALILEPDAFENISGILDAESFYRDENRTIFEVLKELNKADKKTDLIILTQELKNRGLLEDLGGAAKITGLTRKVVTAANLEAHARIVAEKHFQRESIKKATEIIRMCYQNEDVDSISGSWHSSLDSLDNIFTSADTGTHIRDVLKSAVVQIEEDAKRIEAGLTPGITTGFTSLDNNTGGWRGGTMITLAARPSIGKTSLALHFAKSAAEAGYWVNIFSLEMIKEDLAKILLSGASEVRRANIRDGYLQQSDWIKINKGISELEKLPIIFRDSTDLTINQIYSIARKNARDGRCNLVIIDYLQLIKVSRKNERRELDVGEISRTIKSMSLKLNIPVISLSQLNREADGQKPKLSHLRESGSLEQDSDIVIFLHPEEEDVNLRMIVAKHRGGATGDTIIAHNEDRTAFSDAPDIVPITYESDSLNKGNWTQGQNDLAKPF